MNFSKYHGCGNNFIVAKYEEVKALDFSQLAIKVCDYYTGIGADGLIIVKDNPLEMIFYNQDGSRAEMCGNGIRCFADFVIKNHLTNDQELEVKTLGGLMRIEVVDDEYKVNMGKPLYDAERLKLSRDVDLDNIMINGYQVSSLFMGTIHSVIIVDKIDYNQVEAIGKDVCNNELFKEKTNVNFVEVIDENNIKVLTYERGVGITKACGTGCTASFVVLNKKGLINDQVKVYLELGTLTISKENEYIMMQGPAEKIAEIQMEVKAC